MRTGELRITVSGPRSLGQAQAQELRATNESSILGPTSGTNHWAEPSSRLHAGQNVKHGNICWGTREDVFDHSSSMVRPPGCGRDDASNWPW